jgi:hypothetical protein
VNLKMVTAVISYLRLSRLKNALRSPEIRRSQRRRALFVFLAGITSVLLPLPSRAQSPQITSISAISTQQYQTITIKGSNFGKLAPYTGDSNYISFEDLTANPGWQAGYSFYDDTVTLIVNSWTNDKIVLGGFSGQWGEYDYTLAIGDSVQIQIWDEKTGNGPATAYTTVGPEATKTTLTSSPNPSGLGEAVSFTASVTSPAGPPPDGEMVSFNLGKTVLGTGILSNGSANFTTSALKAGTHAIVAVYGGDSNYETSKSKAVKQVVN